MAESSDSCGVCAYLLSCAFCCNRDWNAGDEGGGREKRFVLGALLAEYYYIVLCSTVICKCQRGQWHQLKLRV